MDRRPVREQGWGESTLSKQAVAAPFQSEECGACESPCASKRCKSDPKLRGNTCRKLR